MPSRIDTSVNTSSTTVVVDVPSTDIPTRPRASSMSAFDPNRPPPTQPLGAPTSSPSLAPPPGGGTLPPLVGAGTTVTVPAGPPAPRARAQSWSMGQAVGGGGALITFARTPAPSATTTSSSSNSTTSTSSSSNSNPNSASNTASSTASNSTTSSSDSTTSSSATTTSPDPTVDGSNPSRQPPTVLLPITTSDPLLGDPSQQAPTVVDPLPPPPQKLPPKPWPNPDRPDGRHIRLATAGINTKAKGEGTAHRNELVTNALQDPDDVTGPTRSDLDFVATSFEVMPSLNLKMRTRVLAEAHQRLFKIREDLHGRRPISGLEDLHASTLKWADVALAEADATKDVDQRLAQLREAYHSLREAHALTLHGEDPDAVCDYLDKCLADAEADAAADRAHFSAVSSNQSVQKLYVAPEWMFRRSAGAPYSTAEFKRIAARVTAISNKYPDWLIIPGTVYYGEPIGDGKFFVRNEALVAHAGDLRVVSKQHEQDAMAANEVWYPRPNESTRFKAGGHTYAVEICRDHYKAIAAEESDDLVDFHVITSNGVAVAPHAVAARDGGLVVHVDGQFGATTVYRVQWRENPNAGEAKEFRERARAMRQEITALDIEWTAGNAEASKLQAQISQRKAKMRQQGKFNKDDATLKRLEKQREELDDAGCNIMLRQKAVSNKLNAEAAKFLELAPISGGDGIQIPENLLELDRDRYA